ncbi:MAG: hypothetical protein J6K12_01410, partial [Clostridia bacterium]|nr:hypothetical protein [Clostridia bacterium]
VLDASIGTGMEVVEADTVVLTVSKKTFKRPEKNEQTDTGSGGQTTETTTETPSVTENDVPPASESPTESVTPPVTKPENNDSSESSVEALLGMRQEN